MQIVKFDLIFVKFETQTSDLYRIESESLEIRLKDEGFVEWLNFSMLSNLELMLHILSTLSFVLL